MFKKIMKGLITMMFVLPLSTGISADTKYELATFAGMFLVYGASL